MDNYYRKEVVNLREIIFYVVHLAIEENKKDVWQ